MYERYLVTLATPEGEAQLEVPTMSGPDVAARRAYMSALAQGWGDVDEIKIKGIELLPEEVSR